MITHELAKDMVTNNIMEWFRNELLAYITQQENKDKLLELYQDLYNSLSGCDIDEIYKDLTQKIKKLEDELK